MNTPHLKSWFSGLDLGTTRPHLSSKLQQLLYSYRHLTA